MEETEEEEETEEAEEEEEERERGDKEYAGNVGVIFLLLRTRL